jgi:hypothetical protein
MLPALNHPEPRQREQATRELDRLGAAGVLAALRLDPSGLTPEQIDRLAEFIARHSTTDADPVVLRSDRTFLEACLTDPDPRVRDAAEATLRELAD